jgi:hypothetical protein
MTMRPLSRIFLALALLAPPLEAQRTAERGWALSSDGMVKIFNFAGSIRVMGWDRDSVAVTATFPAGLTLFGGGDRSSLKFGIEGEQRGPEQAASLVVRVPANANVWVRGAATTVDVEGLIGIVDVGTVGGALRVRGSPRVLTAETMNGPLEVEGSPEIFRATTATGELRWNGAARDATLSTVSGAVVVSGGPLGRARIASVAGNVRLRGSVHTDGEVVIETHSGNIDVVLPKANLKRVSARTFKGSVRLAEH